MQEVINFPFEMSDVDKKLNYLVVVGDGKNLKKLKHQYKPALTG